MLTSQVAQIYASTERGALSSMWERNLELDSTYPPIPVFMNNTWAFSYDSACRAVMLGEKEIQCSMVQGWGYRARHPLPCAHHRFECIQQSAMIWCVFMADPQSSPLIQYFSISDIWWARSNSTIPVLSSSTAHTQFLGTPNYSDLPNSLNVLTGMGWHLLCCSGVATLPSKLFQLGVTEIICH